MTKIASEVFNLNLTQDQADEIIKSFNDSVESEYVDKYGTRFITHKDGSKSVHTAWHEWSILAPKVTPENFATYIMDCNAKKHSRRNYLTDYIRQMLGSVIAESK